MRNTNTSLERLLRRALTPGVLLLSMLGAYIATSGLLEMFRPTEAATARADAATSDGPIDAFASADGMHLVAFVITASDCGWSAQPRTMEALGSIRESMRAIYGGKYVRVGVVGVAIDDDPETGVAFLTDIGGGTVRRAFDQVAIGGSWLNEQIVRLVWRDGVAEAATPQVIVLERVVDTSLYASDYTIGISNDRVVANATGYSEVFQWLEQGLPLDHGNNKGQGQLPERARRLTP